jgi:hypothetical protein
MHFYQKSIRYQYQIQLIPSTYFIVSFQVDMMQNMFTAAKLKWQGDLLKIAIFFNSDDLWHFPSSSPPSKAYVPYPRPSAPDCQLQISANPQDVPEFAWQEFDSAWRSVYASQVDAHVPFFLVDLTCI